MLVIGMAMIAQNMHSRAVNDVLDPERIERLVQERLVKMEGQLERIKIEYPSIDNQAILASSNNSIFIYEGDSLVFWSDNSIAIPELWSNESFHDGLIEFPNLLGLCSVKQKGNITIAGVIPLQYSFPIENEFLSNEFLIGGFRSVSYDIVKVYDTPYIIIHDKDENPLFGLERSNYDKNSSLFWFFSVGLFGLGIIFVLCFMLDLLRLGYALWTSNWWLVIMALDFGLLRWLLSYFKIPELFYSIAWFEPFEGPIRFFESQGDGLISLIFILFLSLAINKWLKIYPKKFDKNTKEKNPRLVDSFTAIAWFIVFGAWFAMNRFWLFLLQQCEDVIEIHQVLTLDLHTVVDILLLAISAASFILILYRISKYTVEMYPIKRFALVPVVSGVVFFAITRNAGQGPGIISMIVLVLMIASCGLSIYRKENHLNQFGMVFQLLFIAAFMVFSLEQTNKSKEHDIQMELIEIQLNEHDSFAESLLENLDEGITSDSTLIELIRDPRTDESEVRNYLLNNLLENHWNRYDIEVNICDSVNELVFSNENQRYVCLDYYNDVIKDIGNVLGETHFYYVDNFDGKVEYLGLFPVYTEDSAYVYHLIISAVLVLDPEGLGYPDVLIASDNSRDNLWDDYSYAKYQDCQLISRSGKFVYAYSCESYPSEFGTVTHHEYGGYDHWISELDKEGRSKIVLSKPKTSLMDHLISFSYLFVGLYIVWIILSLFFFLPKKINRRGLDLKSKIQVSMISILVISFLLIGGGMNYFIINQYDQTNRKTISEKIQSVNIEVMHKLDAEQNLSADWQGGDYPNLQSLLVKFSYVFNTDINIYNPQGSLLASSRPEVFTRQLTGTQMDPNAFFIMDSLKQMELVHRENIGGLGFWSAYVPFYNADKELLAYLNLPYFSKQSEIRKEVSTFLVAILNGYFLLIFLTVVFAVFLGNQLTRPLRLIQERFSDMQLGSKNTQIEYHKKDEIGGLVAAYNLMVEQLEDSAEILAKSERESAWREMAKQIAHEIKNPLTPMKLSVQHLKKSWDDRIENWDSYLDRVTETLVEQIDALTAIANEFSQFAQMPKAKRQELDFVAKVEKSIALFRESGSSNINLDVHADGPLIVFLDKDQLLQVFNNLINNAIQAVPQGEKPEIGVSIYRKESKVLLSVSDNGSGIPLALQDKLFQPNFTTKSSGMGLGLAIVKNIIENSKGKIWFETGTEGTTFFVEFPLV